MLDDIVGGLIGGDIGLRLRARLIRRKYRRALAGKDVRIHARARLVSAPSGRELWGSLRRCRGIVSWRPNRLGLLFAFSLVPPRRWGSGEVRLDQAQVLGTSRRRSVARGDRMVVHVAGVDPLRGLSLSPDRLPAAEVLLRRD